MHHKFLNSGTKIAYLQTCAHNLLQEKDLKGEGFIQANEVIFSGKKNGNESYVAYEVSECICHPKYDGSPFSGYDFAICIINTKSAVKKNNDTNHYAKPSDSGIEHGKFEPLESVG